MKAAEFESKVEQNINIDFLAKFTQHFYRNYPQNFSNLHTANKCSVPKTQQMLFMVLILIQTQLQ
jgi:hypothetical protein